VQKRGSKASRGVGDETRERILEGASRAFGKLGYAVTRVEDILEAADVSRPTFYKAFDGKDDVFEVLSERHHREIRERIMHSLEGVSDPLAQLEAIVDTFMRWRAELGPMGRVLDQEARTPGTLIARHRKETLLAMTTFSAERLAAAGRDEVDPVLYQGLIAAMESIADALLQKRPVRESAIDRARRSALRIVASALGATDATDGPLPPLPRPPLD
jgi:AcrR family transcriptional regulator